MLFAFLGVHLSEHHYNEQCATQQDTNDSSAINNCPSVGIGLSVWASANHDAIEALAAIGGLIFSFVLTVSTVFLWIETRNAAAAAAEQTKLTRQTIELGNKEFIASHRPRIRVRRIYFLHFAINESLKIRVQAANIGESDAKILAIGIDIYNPGQKYDATAKDVFDLPKVPPGKEAHLDYLVKRPWTQAQVDALKSHKVPVWLLGIIVYEDENKTVRDTSFVRVYSPTYERFTKAPDTHPEIDREYEN